MSLLSPFNLFSIFFVLRIEGFLGDGGEREIFTFTFYILHLSLSYLIVETPEIYTCNFEFTFFLLIH